MGPHSRHRTDVVRATRADSTREAAPATRLSLSPARSTLPAAGRAVAPAEAADAPNRWRVTAEVLVSKIFPAGFGWQAASVVAGNQGMEADTLGFAPAFDLKEDISWYFTDNYVAQGGKDKEFDFSDDEVVLGALLK